MSSIICKDVDQTITITEELLIDNILNWQEYMNPNPNFKREDLKAMSLEDLLRISTLWTGYYSRLYQSSTGIDLGEGEPIPEGMKRCKECGKFFKPVKRRQSYCEATHYRPCPICGKLEIAKYLSDPARRCKECKNNKKINYRNSTSAKADEVETVSEVINQSSKDVDIVATTESSDNVKDSDNVTELECIDTSKKFTRDEILNNVVRAKYTGPNLDGYTFGNVYLIQTRRNRNGYTITELGDDKVITLSSMTSVNQYFKRCE